MADNPVEPQETAVPCGVCRCCEYGLDCRKPRPNADLAERVLASFTEKFGDTMHPASPVALWATQLASAVAAEAEARGRAEEREACARLCDANAEDVRRFGDMMSVYDGGCLDASRMLANAIRRRGEAEKKGGG